MRLKGWRLPGAHSSSGERANPLPVLSLWHKRCPKEFFHENGTSHFIHHPAVLDDHSGAGITVLDRSDPWIELAASSPCSGSLSKHAYGISLHRSPGPAHTWSSGCFHQRKQATGCSQHDLCAGGACLWSLTATAPDVDR